MSDPSTPPSIRDRLIVAALETATIHGLAKLSARMTPDQRGAIELFESAGFRAEALLRDQVVDRQGGRHDIAILSLDLERDASRREAFGIAGD